MATDNRHICPVPLSVSGQISCGNARRHCRSSPYNGTLPQSRGFTRCDMVYNGLSVRRWKDGVIARLPCSSGGPMRLSLGYLAALVCDPLAGNTARGASHQVRLGSACVRATRGSHVTRCWIFLVNIHKRMVNECICCARSRRTSEFGATNGKTTATSLPHL